MLVKILSENERGGEIKRIKKSELRCITYNANVFAFTEITTENIRGPFFQASKPIMEKKRRARINESLNELKTLILEAMRKDVSIV